MAGRFFPDPTPNRRLIRCSTAPPATAAAVAGTRAAAVAGTRAAAVAGTRAAALACAVARAAAAAGACTRAAAAAMVAFVLAATAAWSAAGCMFDPGGASVQSNHNTNNNSNANNTNHNTNNNSNANNTNQNNHSVCGNAVIEPGETCDGTNLGGHTCILEGFAGGTLACRADCAGFDTTGCVEASDWCGNDLVLHLDAAAISGLAHSDPVALWPDTSANSYHAAQPDPALQPRYLQAVQNGLPVVRFNGHWLSTPTVTLENDQLTVFAVTRGNHSSARVGCVLQQRGSGWEGDPTHPLNSFDKRLRLTTDPARIDSALSHFPLTVFLNAQNGDTARVFDEIGADFQKIAIADTAPTPVQYYVEVEYWDPGAARGVLHFGRAGQTLPADTPQVFYLYYDADHADNTAFVGQTGSAAAQNVWDAHFMGRWDGKDAPSAAAYLDSTANAHHGTKKATAEPSQAPGKIGYAQSYDGVDDYIELPFLFDPATTDFTLSTWLNPAGANIRVFVAQKDGSGTGRSWMYLDDEGALTNFFDNAPHPAGHITTNGTWVHAALTWSGSTLQWYVAGVAQNTHALTIEAASGGHVLGIQKYLEIQPYSGLIDETRLSDSARSAAWIRATYHTTNDTFLTYGSEQTKPPPNLSYQYRDNIIQAAVRLADTPHTLSITNTSGPVTGFVLGALVSNPTDATLYIDGAAQDTATHPALPDQETAPLIIGGLFLDGDIAELIVCRRALTANERTAIETHLGVKWLGW
jgi:hypothetical protein